MRSVSYVERVALDFSGNLFTQAICLGDTDNDGLNELVVGDTNGKLYVYKSDDCKPWITRSCIGMVTCVGVGDICNKGKNFVVAVGAEGWFHIFDLSGISTKSESSSHHDFLFGDEQKAFYTQHIPANTKVMLISDIDGDGKCEMVVGYTDRVVRAFRWEDSSVDTSGQLVLLKKWLLEGQVDSLTVNPGPDGTPELMVSQPGCGYAVLLCTWRLDQERLPKRDPSGASNSESLIRDVILHQTSGRIHNKNVSTHLIGSINRGSCDDSSKAGLFALCTLDGDFSLLGFMCLQWIQRLVRKRMEQTEEIFSVQEQTDTLPSNSLWPVRMRTLEQPGSHVTSCSNQSWLLWIVSSLCGMPFLTFDVC
ncbi:KICSTOR complex protein ITFG2 isoform X3 [Heterodontus francisci]|uniref:KICSTOR complex protein ITFG2 isoform X3 n=1 Tax=Heterodontus francisci TaxID=7792 RepID=UPI00355C1D68